MTLSPAAITRLHEPSSCDKRTWLRDVEGLEPAPDGPFQVFIKDQGDRHELAVFNELLDEGLEIMDAGGYDDPHALDKTLIGIDTGEEVIYQGMLKAELEVAGEPRTVLGYPDFLIREGDDWVIGDAKLTRRLYESSGSERSDKKAIFLQMRLYGLLFEAMFPGVSFRLRVYNGAGGQDEVAFDDGGSALDELARVIAIRELTEAPEAIVGWTHCGGCGYKPVCWPVAEQEKALGVVIDIDRRLAPKLMAEGIASYPEVAELTPEDLAAIKAKSGADVDGSRRIIENVEALIAGKPARRRDGSGQDVPIDPAVSADANYVMFDIEGLPPQLNEQEKIYLWGLQVFGENQGEFQACLAGFGDGGDEEGWREFLRQSRAILDEHPGIRFVHWHHYDRRMVEAYLDRYGDDAHATGAEVVASLLDLHPIVKGALAVPAPSYSLKVIEALDDVKRISGFERSADEVSKGDESIVAYMEAVETDDMSRREEIINSLCAYNEEDLQATWAVMEWLRSFE